MKRWLFALGLLMSVGAQAQQIDGFRWDCKPTGRNSMECRIKNDLSVPANLCMQVVKVCKDGDHVADVCSGLLEPQDVASKVVKDFQPKVKIFEKCMGVEYRNKEVTR